MVVATPKKTLLKRQISRKDIRKKIKLVLFHWMRPHQNEQCWCWHVDVDFSSWAFFPFFLTRDPRDLLGILLPNRTSTPSPTSRGRLTTLLGLNTHLLDSSCGALANSATRADSFKGCCFCTVVAYMKVYGRPDPKKIAINRRPNRAKNILEDSCTN